MILMVFCIVFSILLNSINSGLNVNNLANAILQGILCWGVAVGVNQTAKQLVKDE
ncbi:MAG: phage holin family protein [Clostridium neonatale]